MEKQYFSEYLVHSKILSVCLFTHIYKYRIEIKVKPLSCILKDFCLYL